MISDTNEQRSRASTSQLTERIAPFSTKTFASNDSTVLIITSLPCPVYCRSTLLIPILVSTEAFPGGWALAMAIASLLAAGRFHRPTQ